MTNITLFWCLKKKELLLESWNIRMNFGSISVGGCRGQPMLLFWKTIDKTQMSKPLKCAASFFKTWRSILVGHFGFQSVLLEIETPCIVFWKRSTHNGNFLLKSAGLFAGSAISITKIRPRYVVPRPSCTFTLQSLRKWSF